MNPAFKAHAEACLFAIRKAVEDKAPRQAARELGTSEKGLSRFLSLQSCPSPITTWRLHEMGFRVPLCPEGFRAYRKLRGDRPGWVWGCGRGGPRLGFYVGDPEENAKRVLSKLFERYPELAPLRRLTIIEAMRMVEEAQREAAG